MEKPAVGVSPEYPKPQTQIVFHAVIIAAFRPCAVVLPPFAE
jgi:hypothetical protein